MVNDNIKVWALFWHSHIWTILSGMVDMSVRLDNPSSRFLSWWWLTILLEVSWLDRVIDDGISLQIWGLLEIIICVIRYKLWIIVVDGNVLCYPIIWILVFVIFVLNLMWTKLIRFRDYRRAISWELPKPFVTWCQGSSCWFDITWWLRH